MAKGLAPQWQIRNDVAQLRLLKGGRPAITDRKPKGRSAKVKANPLAGCADERKRAWKSRGAYCRSAPNKDVHPLLCATPKQTFGRGSHRPAWAESGQDPLKNVERFLIEVPKVCSGNLACSVR